MSSMLKKKGGLAFKPKVPQARRGAATSTPTPAPTLQSTERQSQTPVPAAPPLDRRDATVTAVDGQHPPPPPPPPITAAAPPPRPVQAAPVADALVVTSVTLPSPVSTAATTTLQASGAGLATSSADAESRQDASGARAAVKDRPAPRSGRSSRRDKGDGLVNQPASTPQSQQSGSASQPSSRSEILAAATQNIENLTRPAEGGARETAAAALPRRRPIRKQGETQRNSVAPDSNVPENSGSSTHPVQGTRRGASAASSSTAVAEIGGVSEAGGTTSTATTAASPSGNAVSGSHATAQQAPIPEANGAAAPQKKQRKRKATAPSTGIEGAAEENQAAAPRKRARYTKRNTATVDHNSDQVATAAGQENGEASQPQKRRARKSKPAEGPRDEGAQDDGGEGNGERRQRSVTPEDAENRTVDHRELRMEELTKDLRIGKKFSRHDELLKRERQKRSKYRTARLQAKLGLGNGSSQTQADGSEAGAAAASPGRGSTEPSAATPGAAATAATATATATAATAGTATAATAAAPSAQPPPPPPGPAPAVVAGPQFEIIDGTIVVNQASLVHDRHAAAAAEAGELEEVEENDFTRLTTSSTYLRAGKLRGPNAWTAAETEHFYRALAMLGTDFTMMAAMFPGKTRRHVKLKFNREERANPRRIDAALIGEKKVPIDLAEYASYTGLTYKTTHALQAEFDDREREHHATQKRLADEQADALRRRRELLFGPPAPAQPPADSDADSRAVDADTDAEDHQPDQPRAEPAAPGNAGEAQQPQAGRDALEHEVEEVVDETGLPPGGGDRAPGKRASGSGRGRGRGGRGRGGARGAGAKGRPIKPAPGGFGV